jgi:hypothetical protein
MVGMIFTPRGCIAGRARKFEVEYTHFYVLETILKKRGITIAATVIATYMERGLS